ncbi:hypothetical protein C8J56DRAFT_477429 [Mycena floridula]|nr:hypothetical protein C8J56DRAFT_477429 [Mycena floridula]
MAIQWAWAAWLLDLVSFTVPHQYSLRIKGRSDSLQSPAIFLWLTMSSDAGQTCSENKGRTRYLGEDVDAVAAIVR